MIWQNNFKNIQYVDSSHTYYDTVTNKSLTSVTSLLKQLRQPFDSHYWSIYTALKENKIEGLKPLFYNKSVMIGDEVFHINDLDLSILNPSPDDITKRWNTMSKLGTEIGTYLHNTMENLMIRKNISIPIPNFVSSLSSIDAVRYLKARETLYNLANSFYKEFISNRVPIATEFVIGNSDLGIAGTFDLLAYNLDTNEYELWDYKTDKQIRTKSEYRNTINGFNVDDCEFNKYSLQLGIYKYLLKDVLPITKCNIVHFDYKKETYSIIETIDYSKEIKEFFNNGYNKSIYF